MNTKSSATYTKMKGYLQMSKWISVKNKLPEFGVVVVVTDGVQVGIAFIQRANIGCHYQSPLNDI